MRDPQQSAAVDFGQSHMRALLWNHGSVLVKCCGVQVLWHIVKTGPRKSHFLCVDVLAGVTFGPKKCSFFIVENRKTTTHCHNEEHVGCSFLIFALKAAELIINTDRIMAQMTKPLALHSKS